MNNKNLIHELIEKGYDLEKLKPYEEFLIECIEKNYQDLPTQIHHILPKCMNDGEYANETIKLSLLDHFNAHLILANCFDRNTDERRKNLSACKYIKVHVKRYMTKMNFEVPEEFQTFWNLAHEIMKDFNKGENNIFFGKKHSEETKELIREKRKLQVFTDETREKLSESHKGEKNHFYGKTHSEETKELIREKRKLQVFSEETIEKHRQRLRTLPNTQRGEDNPYFGKTFDERFGIEKSAIIRQKLKDRIQERAENKPLPEGIFKCDEIINGELKRYFRYCPNEDCGNKIYYKGKDSKPGQVIVEAQRNGKCCQECRIKQRYKEVIIPERKRSHSISNRIIMKDNRTGIIYDSRMDLIRQLKLHGREFDRLLESGVLEVVENKSSWDKRRANKE